jgi:uncharacterized protein YdhG (YjbR/CyaY superfamily)
MRKAKDVDEFIAKAPKEFQGNLKALRAMILSAVPEAEEHISYGMPYYGHMGRLAYFAPWKKHIGLYIPPPIIGEHKDELGEYETTVSAVHLPLGKKLPKALIKRLIKARAKKNEEKKKKQLH